MELVGIVRCPLQSLKSYGTGRNISPKEVARLKRRFESKCEPELSENQIQGVVTGEDLNRILTVLGKSREGLLGTLARSDGKPGSEYPILSDVTISCLNGRHRLAAAAASSNKAQTAWWVVRLYCVKGNWKKFPVCLENLTTGAAAEIRRRTEYTSHESKYRDGETFTLIWEIRQLKGRNTDPDQNEVEDEYWDRLSESKQSNLNALLGKANAKIAKAFYRLTKFPGVIWGLQLGNIHKHLADRTDELVLNYLGHILAVWNRITDNKAALKSCVDPATVLALQRFAPMSSKADRKSIGQLFREDKVFTEVKDPEIRKGLEQRVLSLPCVIPSLETFHDNMIYMSVGAKIIREQLLDKPIRKEDNIPRLKMKNVRRRSKKPTLQESLARDWVRPSATYVEEAKSKFSVYDKEPTVDLAFCMLFLIALRYFPKLSTISPRVDVRSGCPDDQMMAVPQSSTISYLANAAQLFGFNNSKIRSRLSSSTGMADSGAFQPKEGPLKDWRSGRPFNKTYLILEEDGFLPRLAALPTNSNTPSSAFFLYDMLKAFF
ncbi:Protein of unknown function (DUF3723) domain containing protein, partial [Rhypophila sp. PSN 637]